MPVRVDLCGQRLGGERQVEGATVASSVVDPLFDAGVEREALVMELLQQRLYVGALNCIVGCFYTTGAKS